MRIEQDRDYHIQRARTELDWAYRAERRDVAAAHLRLSALHMERVKLLSAPIADQPDDPGAAPIAYGAGRLTTGA